MKKLIEFLNYKTYEYPETHRYKFTREDASKISIVMFVVTFMMMFTIIMYVLNPMMREHNGDIIYYAVTYFVLSLFGGIMCRVKLKDESKDYHFCRFCIIYSNLVFVSMAIYNYIHLDLMDALFVVLICCIFNTSVLHTNPIVFSVVTIMLTVLGTPQIVMYFKSPGTMQKLYVIIGILIYISFESNLRVHDKLKNIDRISQINVNLEAEIERKTAMILDSLKQQSSIQENVIFAIADLVENRDTDTGDHIKATSFYVKTIALQARKNGYCEDILTDEYINLMEKAAPMHDIGKIMTPDNILKAPRRLTDEEFEIMKSHAVEGARIVRHVYHNIESPEYIECAANVAHYHHEKWNGKGYPDGLASTEIPLEARIMAIADVFDALVSKRCYKDSYSLSEAFTMIAEDSGTHFDPELVKAFMDAKDDIMRNIIQKAEESV